MFYSLLGRNKRLNGIFQTKDRTFDRILLVWGEIEKTLKVGLNFLEAGIPALHAGPSVHARDLLHGPAGQKGEQMLVLFLGADVDNLLFKKVS